MFGPNDYYYSLAPSYSEGIFFKPSGRPFTEPCTADQAWKSPQVNAMLYQFMGAFAFSAIVEPVILYCAKYKMHSPKDAELAIWGVEISMLVYDFMHSFAEISVVGSASVIPGFSWSNVDSGACVNAYAPLVWAIIRMGWLSCLGRTTVRDNKTD